MNWREQFHLGPGTYLLSHSAGRPLKSVETQFISGFFAPWITGANDPWSQWMNVFNDFRTSLGLLFQTSGEGFCPQVNLSSAVCKIIMSLEVLQKPGAVILMSEMDFPSMGFAMKQALPASCSLRFVPAASDLTDPSVWDAHLTSDVSLVFVSQAYSNTGRLAPWTALANLCRARGILTILDVAQSAGVVPLDLRTHPPSFMVGSCLKWLCSGPGAGFLWVNPDIVDTCHPRDVGWFSHQNPFEMDIHHFQEHSGALRFWGGTPSVAPFVIAAHSVQYFARVGPAVLRKHNQGLIDSIAAEFGDDFISPRDEAVRSGTCVLNFGPRQDRVLESLRARGVSVDVRRTGIRVSPHIYNQQQDIQSFVTATRAGLV